MSDDNRVSTPVEIPRTGQTCVWDPTQ